MSSAWTADRIRALRKAVGESTATFGAKVGRSSRTVEDWEQGRYAPDLLVERLLTTRARRVLSARARQGVPADPTPESSRNSRPGE